MKSEKIEDITLIQAASRFAALGSEQRLAVLRTLVRAGPQGLAIGALGERVGLSGSTLTHHVKILVDAGLVRQNRDGRRILCHGVFPEVSALSEFLLRECCADSSDMNKGPSHG